MIKIADYDAYGYHLTQDDDLLLSVLDDMVYNNTCFPDIMKLEAKKVMKKTYDEKGNVLKDKKGVAIRREADVLVVRFADGTWVEVTRNPKDKDDSITAILYAIVKRLFGTPNEGGYVKGNGFMSKLLDLSNKIVTEEDIEKAKAERIAKKEAEDKKAHEEAVKRRRANPTIGSRLFNLEEKFNKLLETLAKPSKK